MNCFSFAQRKQLIPEDISNLRKNKKQSTLNLKEKENLAKNHFIQQTDSETTLLQYFQVNTGNISIQELEKKLQNKLFKKQQQEQYSYEQLFSSDDQQSQICQQSFEKTKQKNTIQPQKKKDCFQDQKTNKFLQNKKQTIKKNLRHKFKF